MINKTFSTLLSIQIIVLFFLGTGICFFESAQAQQPTNPDLQIMQPQLERRITIPPELLRQSLVTVPPLEGRNFNIDEIIELLDIAGLQLGKTVPVANNERIGIIISQNPPPRQQVRRETPVDLTYGIATEITPGQPENVSVPSYIGLTIERIESRMPNDQLIIGVINEVPSEEIPGIVIEQFPDPGMIVDPGTPVDLTFSVRPPPEEELILVPYLIGLSLQEAAEILRESELYAGQLIEEETDSREGVVINQSPREGERVPLGSAVDITFSVRNNFVIVPDVTGLLQNKAAAILNESRLNYSFEYETDSDEPEDLVIEQEPLPETRVLAGSNVQLIVAGSRKELPPWIYWIGGVLAAAVLGGFLGKKIGKNGKKSLADKDFELKLKPVLDTGKQHIKVPDNSILSNHLHLKYILDVGVQTIKNV